jgi:hypothetical protein
MSDENVVVIEPDKNTGSKKGKKNHPLPPVQAKDGELLSILSSLSDSLGTLNSKIEKLENKVDDIENKGANSFKREPKLEDVVVAQENRKGLDPKISQIVDEMLGVDFGAEVKPLGDRPGFRFSIIVPSRLSDNVADKRPVMELDADGNKTGNYLKDSAGNVVFENYIPEDRRSRILSSSDSYDAIKGHCEKVRGYIVSYFQKTSKPLPEFKVR